LRIPRGCTNGGGRKTHSLIRAGLATALVLATLGRRATAQGVAPTPAEPARDSPVEQARAELRKGLALFQAGDPERALTFFLRSRAIFAAKGNTLDAAICLDRLGRYDEALELYEEALSNYGAAFSEEERSSIPQATASLRAKVGTLAVSANVDGTVVVDGRERGRLPLAAALRLLPGRHQVRVLKDGYVTFEKEVEILTGTAASIDARLEALQAAGGLRVEDAALPDADVLVDGVVLGPAPWEGRLAPGMHVVRTRKGESGSAPTRAAVIQGQTTLIRVKSVPLGPVRHLTVTPPTAELYLEGVPLGKGRWEGPLPAGTYRLEASEEGYVSQGLTFTEEMEGTPGDRATSLTLPVDEASPRWPRKPTGHVILGAMVGYAAGPSLHSDAESACPAACSSHGVLDGLWIGARVGYELPFRLAVELEGGHFSLSDTVARSAAAGALAPGVPITYDLHDLLRLNSYFFGAGVSYATPLVPGGASASGLAGVRLRSRVSGGLLVAQSTDVLTGTATAGVQSTQLGIPGAGDTLTTFPFFLRPEVGMEVPFGSFRLGLELSAFFVASDGPIYPFGPATVPPACTPNERPPGIGCAKDSAVLENERAFRPFGVFLPQLTASYAL
jgi:hypothetical protein